MRSIRSMLGSPVAPAPEEKKQSASQLGKKCWGVSCFLLTLGFISITSGSAISYADCSFTAGVPDKNSADCGKGFYLIGFSLLLAVGSWCGFGISNQIRRGEAREALKAAQLQKPSIIAANPATQFAPAALTEIKVENVAPKSPAP